ncbi:glutamine-hydrolyzing GMP synthase [Synechococcus lacustris]|uniref:GMP synthase (glutamine-hydrolyzing) n=1 Tax=Synechococcus lacustris str. Tous TaxID=1910958 RepID=A0A2P7EGZ9_9SYNE|nr:glutamine-hydrolyzing GMP synthase [Synechococcus lacustris]PSI02492.1 GMP synthase (glutamine-hydrolyzing) [Synechococcus lacustris str. Tous]
MSAALAGLEGAEGRRPAIVILDFGSQYSELIARRVRETEVYSLVLSHTTTLEQLRELAPKGIILSGGPNSVYADGAPVSDPGLWELGIPVLGVCYGMQLMVQQLGGRVEASERGEYGKAPLWVDDPTDLLTNVDDGSTMWMSHGDSVVALPEGFSRLAHTDNTPEAVVANHQRRLYGVQFHPEVVHSSCGMALLRNFVYHICGCAPDWTTDVFIDEAIASVRAQVGDKRVLLGKKLGPFDYLAQGTLYPDVIESAGTNVDPKTGERVAVKIKSHHNVGGLPKDLQFKLVEPLRRLFKDEVRKVGRSLGLPEEIVRRHPFPGPGLAIRILGEVNEEKLQILRDADLIVREEVRDAGLYHEIWQAFAVLLPVRSVGVMGDKRTYAYPIVLRCVGSEDGMTADWSRLPYEVMERISNRIVNEVEGVNRVVYDITSKPPGTIEWE